MSPVTYSRILLVILALWVVVGSADPAQDRAETREYFKQLFPQLTLQEYADGAYALDPIARSQWLEIEDFPPYEWAVENGKHLFHTPFKGGGRYTDCFPQPINKIRAQYPRVSVEGEVITLELALNQCRQKFQQPMLDYRRGEMAALSAYLAYLSRGEMLEMKTPSSEGEMKSYTAGKQFYYQRRGQLNFSCASCHVQSAGKRLRADMLSPMLGQVTHFPVYSGVWHEMGTLHRRFIGCLEQIRAPVFHAQSEQLRALEYYLSFMSSGIKLNGPAYRK